MAAKTSNRGKDMAEANLQADGLEGEVAQEAVDWWETEGEDSTPHNSLTWSPAQRPPTSCLNVNYCLEIQVTLTDKLGDVLPPTHIWTAPVVKDMLWETKVGLTEAVVIGPGKSNTLLWETFKGRGSKGR